MNVALPPARGDRQPLELRLSETIAWCALCSDVNDPRGSLRSERLRPSVLPASRDDAVGSVTRDRRSQLDYLVGRNEIASIVPIRTAADFGGGQLLYCLPDETLSDGAAEIESKGFFDREEIPPWDTWLALFQDKGGQDVLISWVPPEYLRIANEGLGVTMVDNVGWLTNSSIHPFAAAFTAAGLI